MRPGTRLIAADHLAAQQWEAWLGDRHVEQGHRVWLTPKVQGYGAWTAALWSGTPQSESAGLLTPLQSRALWRRVIADSAQHRDLIDLRAAADWAADAFRRLLAWRLDVDTLQPAAHELDTRAFHSWARSYLARLREQAWLDPAELDGRLAQVAADGGLRGAQAEGDLLFAIHAMTPAQDALLDALRARGLHIESRTSGDAQGRLRRLACDDPAEEVHQALAWAAAWHERAPRARIALVASSATHGRHVRRALTAAGGRARGWLAAGEPPSAQPVIGAALTALELLSPGARFEAFSRWLRSPFFSAADPEAASRRASLEARLRDNVAAQLGFLDAYRRAGLDAVVRRAAPSVADTLDAALQELAPLAEPRTPTRWANLWQRALRQMGWPGWHGDGGSDAARAWSDGLAELGSLTPVLGVVPCGQALVELDAILARPRRAPLALAGLHVLENVEQVGPGYAGCWVMGLTQRDWPGRPAVNPLLPRSLQVERAMPAASPRAVLEHCRGGLRRLLADVPEVVLSWGQREQDEVHRPSTLIVELAQSSPADRLVPVSAPATPRRGGRGRESLADDAPPLRGTRIPGGAAALSLQATCPLRAYGEVRLSARVLSPPARGLPPAARGVAAHHALRLLLEGLPSQAQLAARPPEERTALIGRCVERALDEVFGAARAEMRTLYDLERGYLSECLIRLLEQDLRRAPFKVLAVEERRTVELADYEIAVRIDRIDLLADDRLAVLDYKTGADAGAGVSAWFDGAADGSDDEPPDGRARAVDVQIPLYALAAGAEVGALVLVELRPDRVRFRGAWAVADAFPGRAVALPEGRSWKDQIDAWRARLETLARELAVGDVRLDLDAPESALGPYAPLSRALEQLALAEGWLAP